MAPESSELDLDAAQRRHWRISGIATITVLGIGAAVLFSRGPKVQTCPDANDYLRGIWDARAREAVAAKFGVSSEGKAAWNAASARLDEFADDWVVAYSSTCDALVHSEARDPALLERGACLRWRLEQFEQTVDGLRDPATVVVTQAVPLASGLEAITDCDDPDVVQRILRERPHG